jgi:hypothetical protein
MRTPVLIGIHGVKRSGKGTTAYFIQEWAVSLGMTAADRGFADDVKLIFARQFFPRITMEEAVKWCEEFKETGRVDVIDESGHDGWGKRVSGREALAQFASEGARDILGDDIWLNQLLPAASGWSNRHWGGADICTISDVRFPNEWRRIKDFGGLTIKVRRTSAEDAVIEEARKHGREVHRSELGLVDKHFDYVIHNNSSLADLQQKVTEVMERYAWQKR